MSEPEAHVICTVNNELPLEYSREPDVLCHYMISPYYERFMAVHKGYSFVDEVAPELERYLEEVRQQPAMQQAREFNQSRWLDVQQRHDNDVAAGNLNNNGRYAPSMNQHYFN